jgi:Xaa-Pro aminopeptidase
MPSPNLLIIDDSERNANLYYATRFRAGDPFVFVQIGGRKYLLASDLEVDRARAEANVHAVVRAADLERRLRRQQKKKKTLLTIDLVDAFLRHHGAKALAVPGSFPVEQADALRRRGYRLKVCPEPFFPERLAKSPAEIAAIERAQRAAEEVVRVAIERLRRAAVRGGVLRDREGVLTSERLRGVIERELLDRGYRAERTIVACGRDAMDPHRVGSGPLRPNRAIILDVFPQSIETGYWADMTRTVVRGRASDGLRRMYRAVEEAQSAAMAKIRDGADGKDAHQAVLDVFKEHGFKTGKIGGRMQGFFHGTGHGVGLEIHEPPRLNARGGPLQAGMVITVEPGLYYTQWGGVRIEDLVVVTKDGCRNLTRFPKQLEI